VDIETCETDVLVLGGGMAGHCAAIAARTRGVRVAMAYVARGASPYIIGCNAPFGHTDSRDSEDVYFHDTLRGGYGVNDRRLVRILATHAVTAIRGLEAIGVSLARDGDRYAQRHLSGNTYPRSVYHPDGLGRMAMESLATRVIEIGIDVWPGWKAVSLLRDGEEVVGALLAKRHTNQLLAIRASAVVIAMGGIGALYEESTYPADVVADSYALALSAGARLIDMEFVQFEPTVVAYPSGCKGMEMPTAMLGDGAHLLNAAGERFMFRYNPVYGEKRIEKARLSLCIQREIDEGRGLPDGCVIFDTTKVPAGRLETYVTHCKRLRAAGIEPAHQAPHVRPAAHSQMGGIYIDASGWAGIPGLYVGGEAAGGVHGASRLAGNGATDSIVFGAVAGHGAASVCRNLGQRDWIRIQAQATQRFRSLMDRAGGTTSNEVKSAVRKIMTESAWLYRNQDGLSLGLRGLDSLRNETCRISTGTFSEGIKAIEAEHMILVARMIISAATARTESRGAHQRSDFSDMDDEHWLQHVAIRGAGDALEISSIPLN
jgi:succinate dehydrogenase/fumarate reductase flavoprotein subunit